MNSVYRLRSEKSLIFTRLMLTGLMIAGLLLASCASNPAGDSYLALMSEKKERELGAEMHPQILKQYGVYKNQRLQNYVNKIGQKLAAVSDRPDIEYHFTVLDDDMINAFATPGGYVYVTRGIMAYLNSEAELAAVIGHEIGHVTARHAAKQQGKKSILNALSAVAGFMTPFQTGGLLTNYVGGALLSGFGRKAELQADGLGAKFLAKAGYDPESIIDVLRVMKQREIFEVEQARQEGRKPQGYHGLFASHPDNDKRLKTVVRAADKLQISPDAVINKQGYLRQINGLTFGESSRGRVIRANTFYDSKLGFKISFPDGWTIRNFPDRVIAMSADGNSAIYFTVLPIEEHVVPKTILRQNMKAKSLRETRNITIDGLPSFLAISDHAESLYGKRPVRYALIADQRRQIGFIFAGAGRNDRHKISADPEFIKTIFSFDRMNKTDYRNAKLPRIILIRTAEPLSFEKMADNSIIGSHAEDYLRLLNRRYPDGELETGTVIKIVK